MARIRSLHPGFATDEDLITVSRDARLFLLLLLTECDDQGVFEWKPKTLRMRLFPADDIDAEQLLAELASIDAIKGYEIDGRKLGAVRNFRRYQRPKFPKAVHTITDDIRNYVSLSRVTTEIDSDDDGRIPRNGENSPQMEDGGGRREDEEEESDSSESRGRPRSVLNGHAQDFEVWYAIYPLHKGRGAAEKAYAKATKIAEIPALLEGAKRYRLECTGKDPRYIAHPATWLNQKRWADETPSSTPPPQRFTL